MIPSELARLPTKAMASEDSHCQREREPIQEQEAECHSREPEQGQEQPLEAA